MMERRRLLWEMIIGMGKLDLLHTLTFVNALGANDRQTIIPTSSWDQYDFILFVPDITITPQEGQTTGNWLWCGFTGPDGVLHGDYEAQSAPGIRNIYTASIMLHGYDPVRNADIWRFGFITGRGALMNYTNGQKISDMQNLIYGTYYGGTYGLMSGTVNIYGGKF